MTRCERCAVSIHVACAVEYSCYAGRARSCSYGKRDVQRGSLLCSKCFDEFMPYHDDDSGDAANEFRDVRSGPISWWVTSLERPGDLSLAGQGVQPTSQTEPAPSLHPDPAPPPEPPPVARAAVALSLARPQRKAAVRRPAPEKDPTAVKVRRLTPPATSTAAADADAESDDSDWTPYHMPTANPPLPLPPPQPPPPTLAQAGPARAEHTAHTAPTLTPRPAVEAPAVSRKRSLTLDEWAIRKRRN